MKKIVALGDEHVQASLYNFPGERLTFPGIPINDIELFRAAEKCFNEFDYVFWINSHPFAGQKLFDEQPELLEGEPVSRIISYDEMPHFRGTEHLTYGEDDDDYLLKCMAKSHSEMTGYMMGKYLEKFILLPIPSFVLMLTVPWYSDDFITSSSLILKIVDLRRLLGIEESKIFTFYKTLTKEGYKVLEPEILKFIY